MGHQNTLKIHSTSVIMIIAILGGGVVGGGVVQLLTNHEHILVKHIFVKNKDGKRTFKIPEGVNVTTKIGDLLDDDEVECIVDAMGGVELAWEIMETCFARGKHIVSANKAVLATKLKEIDNWYQNNKSPALYFEAAVAGGVPIINVLKRSLAIDEIKRIGGVLNGTTNYILTRMSKEGLSYEDAIKSAQELGYAEQDPTADVDGHDARHKLILLSRIAFGATFTNDDIPTVGIRDITADDFRYAKICDCTIKLIAESESFVVNGVATVRAFVSPVLVHNSLPISRCDGVLNEIEIRTENLDRMATNGPGAGRQATANSVVSDLLELNDILERGQSLSHPFNRPKLPEGECDTDQYLKDQKFYIRIACLDQLGIIKDIAILLEKYGVSIHSVLQTPIVDHNNVTFAVITEKTSMFNLQHVTREISKCSWVRGNVFYSPYRGDLSDLH